MKNPNTLINETSPYLLQHAFNPVNWYPWNEEVLQQAIDNNKLLLISIGYSSCHWCHVMAHENFEDESVAALMNQNFINIKIDREERPDVDHIYMNALQKMTGHGGWPLNIVALPDGRPFWGVTYLQKEQWIGTLHQLIDLFKQSPNDVFNYAEKLAASIQPINPLIFHENENIFNPEIFENSCLEIESEFDRNWGGGKGAPKFMMPSKYHFLLRLATQNNHENLRKQVVLTLNKMSAGGIFDQLGGGFSRYSTDEKWLVPHFEKMLYDNAFLVSLYSDVFLVTKNSAYKKVVESTLEFVKRELTGEKGNFYCALDADSLNKNGVLEEGAFYVWEKTELQGCLGDNFLVFSDYFNVNDAGYWESEKYVLNRSQSHSFLAKKYKISETELKTKIDHCVEILLKVRNQREKPGLDDKSLTSWNAIMLKAHLDAYRVFQEQEYLDVALRNADFILKNMLQSKGVLFHTFKDEKATVNGFLEDYAFVIDAFIALYENTFDEKWLELACDLTQTALENFYENETAFFYFNSKVDRSLIARPVELQDNVIPSSNSVMAKNLFRLSHFLDNQEYYSISEKMLKSIFSQATAYPDAFFNWLNLLMDFTNDFYELAILGDNVKQELFEINRKYLPNKVIAGKSKKSDLPLLKNRWHPGETWLYVCKKQTCQKPVQSAKEALKLMI